MKLYTEVTLPKAPFSISYEDRLLMMGSCFAETIGNKLMDQGYSVNLNPFGTLYNPVSIADSIRMLMEKRTFTELDLFFYEGLYHSFAFHSSYSGTTVSDCLEGIQSTIKRGSDTLESANCLVVTFGSAWVYRRKVDGHVVANCHKLPEKTFNRTMLTVETIVEDWQDLLQQLWTKNPTLRLLFTVSPIRHWRDGAHANQLSKSVLLLAIDHLVQNFPDRVAYFPAYEILLDELRDYRFYADDMCHPSTLAVEYIFERFKNQWLNKCDVAMCEEWEKIKRSLSHRPFRPDGREYKNFLSQTLLKMQQFQDKFPNFDISKETDQVKALLSPDKK